MAETKEKTKLPHLPYNKNDSPEKSNGTKNPEARRDDDGNRIQYYAHFKEGKDYSAIEPDDLTAVLDMFITQGEAEKQGIRPKYENKFQLQDAIMLYWKYLKASYQNGAKIIPDVEGLCAYIGINRRTLNEWERKNYMDAAEIILDAKNKIATAKKQLGLKGRIPPIVLAMDMNNNHDYVSKTETVITTDHSAEQNIPLADLRKKYGAQMLDENVVDGEYKEIKPNAITDKQTERK